MWLSLILCVRLRSRNSPASSVLSVIYRPGSKPLNSQFFTEISEHIESLMSYSCPVYITGDFNVNIEDKSDSCLGELCEIFDTFRLTQHVV